jgi:hypothetical protein
MVMSKSMRVQQHLQHAHGDLGGAGRADHDVGRSPSNTIDGTTELKRALPEPADGAAGRGSKTPMQPLYMKPARS